MKRQKSVRADENIHPTSSQPLMIIVFTGENNNETTMLCPLSSSRRVPAAVFHMLTGNVWSCLAARFQETSCLSYHYHRNGAHTLFTVHEQYEQTQGHTTLYLSQSNTNKIIDMQREGFLPGIWNCVLGSVFILVDQGNRRIEYDGSLFLSCHCFQADSSSRPHLGCCSCHLSSDCPLNC